MDENKIKQIIKEDKKLIYTINNKEYLRINLPAIKNDEILNKIQKIGGLYIGILNTVTRIFSNSYVIVEFLIPTDKLDEYRNLR